MKHLYAELDKVFSIASESLTQSNQLEYNTSKTTRSYYNLD